MAEFDFPQFGPLDALDYTMPHTVRLAKEIRVLAGQDRTDIFDPFACASMLGIGVQEVQMTDTYAGRLRLDLAEPVIELNRNDSRLRQRFTLCHELAHLSFWEGSPTLPKERGDYSLCADIDRREEQLCDQIASELLMPTKAVIKQLQVLQPCFASVDVLAKHFDVSIRAALVKLNSVPLSGWTLGMATWMLKHNTAPRMVWAPRMRISRKPLLGFRKSAHDQITAAFKTAEETFRKHPEIIGLLGTRSYQRVCYEPLEVTIWRKNANHISGIAFL